MVPLNLTYLHIFLVLRDHWLYICLHLKMEFRVCARGRQWCGIFHYYWWTASIKPRLLFSHSGFVSWGLPFLQLILLTTAGVKCLCGGCKMSPRPSSLCSHIFLVLRDHWLYVCLHLKMEFRSCARGLQWCGIFHYYWWTASIKPRLLFSHSGFVSWGLPFLQFHILQHYFFEHLFNLYPKLVLFLLNICVCTHRYPNTACLGMQCKVIPGVYLTSTNLKSNITSYNMSRMIFIM